MQTPKPTLPPEGGNDIALEKRLKLSAQNPAALSSQSRNNRPKRLSTAKNLALELFRLALQGHN
jgi:hypothetical protein